VSRRVAVLGALLVVLLSRGASAAAPPVQVHSSVDRTAIWVADRLTYTVDLVCDKGIDVLLDDLAKEKLRVNGLEILSSDSSATTDANERTTHRLRYVLTTYRVDSPAVSIEPIAVRYYTRRPGQRLQDMAPAGEVLIPGAAVSFRSTIPENQPTYALRDGRESASRHPLFVRAGSIGMAMVVIALAPAVFLAAVGVRRRAAGRVGRRTARQSRADHRAALERLRSLDVTTDEDRRRAYDAISSAVREHVASRAGVPATALTATEIEDALAHAKGRISREEVSALIASCDEARYGPLQAIPTAQACRDALSTAEHVLAH
jgi:hypothetical protein